MSRKIMRVALDFQFPLNETWEGYLNPYYRYFTPCPNCEGSGYSIEARRLQDLCYAHKVSPIFHQLEGVVDLGNVYCEDGHSFRFTRKYVSLTDEIVSKAALALYEWYAQRHRAADMGDSSADSLRWKLEAHRRLNSSWGHMLDQEDIDGLVESGNLMELTHTWTRDGGWTPKVPAVKLTAEEVNLWALTATMAFCSSSYHYLTKLYCARHNLAFDCPRCKEEEGHGFWPSPEIKEKHDTWTPVEPPQGPGYQLWQTISEGGPVSPVFATPEELADWLSTDGNRIDRETSRESWVKFIRAEGDSIVSLIGTEGNMISGVDAVVQKLDRKEKPDE